MTIEDTFILSLIFFLISTLYSSAGFGGGSSYLAFLTIFGVDFLIIKSIALICNIAVVSGNLLVFSKKELLSIKKAAPLVLVSIPMAFIGGFYEIQEKLFFLILGIALILAAILLILKPNRKSIEGNKKKQSIAIGSSMGIGFLSGLVGIGGGIFLSPTLNFIEWSTSKKIAATASFFILTNSLAGLAGHFTRIKPDIELFVALPLITSVIIGGQIGSRITAFKFNQQHVKVVTAILILLAGMKILADQLKIGYSSYI